MLTPVKDLGAFIRDQRTSAQISLRGLALKAGVSNPYLSQVERGLRRPSADVLTQIAHGLSISVESLLARAGILETAHAPGVVLAIRADDILTERHKQALIDIYGALIKEAQGRGEHRFERESGEHRDSTDQPPTVVDHPSVPNPPEGETNVPDR